MKRTVLTYYEAIARGGIGLLIVESPTIDYPSGSRWRNIYRLDDDKYIEGMSELVQVINKQGCPTFMQYALEGASGPAWRWPTDWPFLYQAAIFLYV